MPDAAERSLDPAARGTLNEARLYFEPGQAEGEGVNLRLYNPDTGEWSIYWAPALGANNLFPPMVGKFEGGRGVFCAYEPFAGQSILTRAVYKTLGKDAFKWEQASRQMVGEAGKPTGYAISRGRNSQSGVEVRAELEAPR